MRKHALVKRHNQQEFIRLFAYRSWALLSVCETDRCPISVDGAIGAGEKKTKKLKAR